MVTGRSFSWIFQECIQTFYEFFGCFVVECGRVERPNV